MMACRPPAVPAFAVALCGAVSGLAYAGVAIAATPSDAAGAKEGFAECVVRRDAKFAAAWLKLLPGSPEEQALIAGSRKSFDACVAKSGIVIDDVTTSRSSLRGPVAGRLLATRLSDLPQVAPLPPGATPWFTQAVMATPDAVMDRGELRTELFAHCVVLRQWPESLAFLRTQRKDPAEVPAMKALGPALSACLTEGTTVSFRPQTLRPMLANAVYHIASMPPSAAIASAPQAVPSAAPVRPAPVAPAAPAKATLPYSLEGL